MEKKPVMIVIAGANGVGKSTLYNVAIKNKFIGAPFINADNIQKEELKDQSMNGAYAAAKIAEQRRDQHLKDKKDFVMESTFSHPSKVELIDKAKDSGFGVILFHVHVQSPDLCVKRVESRVAVGGHDVPEEKIRARYDRNQTLIRDASHKSDRTFIYDNSQLQKKPTLVINMKNGEVIWANNEIPKWAKTLYKDDLAKVAVKDEKLVQSNDSAILSTKYQWSANDNKMHLTINGEKPNTIDSDVIKNIMSQDKFLKKYEFLDVQNGKLDLSIANGTQPVPKSYDSKGGLVQVKEITSIIKNTQ